MTKQDAHILIADAGLSPESMDRADALLAGAGDEISAETAAALADLIDAEQTKDMEEMRSHEDALDVASAELADAEAFVQKVGYEVEEMAKAIEA